MILQERVIARTMLFLIKDWDSFQRAMRFLVTGRDLNRCT